jgi:hypothetical protein
MVLAAGKQSKSRGLGMYSRYAWIAKATVSHSNQLKKSPFTICYFTLKNELTK